jgi:hypothetical protein
MAATVCLGLAQGIAVHIMIESPPQWHWYVTASLLPLPFYLARESSKRAAVAVVPWCMILLMLDAAQIFWRNPYFSWYGASGAAVVAAYAGALFVLPGFVSWIDGEGAFPEWRVSFRNFSRIFFASVIAGVFLGVFFAALSTCAGLARIAPRSVEYAVRWLVRNFTVLAFAAWGTAFHWTAGSRQLNDVLERYVLPVFSCLLPMLSVFILAFIAALPMGVERLWTRGFSSSIILGVLLATGLCSLAAWQGGGSEGGNPREPFFRPVNVLVKISLVPLPILCPLLLYTIGLRTRQYGLTADRALSFALALAFGLWSLAWAFFLVRSWKMWPVFYGAVNRAAFPALGAALILLSSPVCDVRWIVLRQRLALIREYIREGEDAGRFDWRYTTRNLGAYGIRAMEELDAGGEALIAERLGPFASSGQAAEIREKIAAEVASLKEEHERRTALFDGRDEQMRERDFEGFVKSAREAPVFGGELSTYERERLARGCRASLESSKSLYVNHGGWKASFFCLEDMNGDGEPDVLLGVADDIYLLRGDRAFMLGRRTKNYAGGGENKTAISSGDLRIIKNRWDMLQVGDRVFYIEPGDIGAL